eukprot:CAMPEP_0170739740 /NCGR_PEP_ID=MMETSP0437-20130122/5320_1 /TAXON_ID=0 /ORGANISM="Sexangularia sp." /LENGTH=133 /DNA_ID=CAMNT_0011078211 /DNA_START=420 /DNA_END=821 /DNA_ORIENTATION=+
MARTASTLAVDVTAVTVAPSARAICTPNDPTPPPAPTTATLVPLPTCPSHRSFCSAVAPAMGIAAASSNESESGIPATCFAGARQYCAKVPRLSPNTLSPTCTSVTPLPTATTSPAKSPPQSALVGLLHQRAL